MNKPTIREEWMNKDDVTIGAKFDTQDIKRVIAEWWLNKIKEVVGDENEKAEFGSTNLEVFIQIGKNRERQRILKEFGIIK